MAYKLKHFWESVKKPEMNLNGHAYISDFERCKGLVRLAIIDDAQYGQKNRIVDYIEDELMLLDDDIPMNF